MIPRRGFLALAALHSTPALATGVPRLQFPRDFGAHPQSRLEWWYLTGVLHSEALGAGPLAQPLYGYQLTFFRLKGPAPANHPSALAARQVLIGHAALSDLRQGQLLHDQRLARAFTGVAEAHEGDCRVHLRDWLLRREPGASDVQGDGGAFNRYVARFQGQSHGRPFAMDLTLQCPQPVLLQGVEGISKKGPAPDQFSHYYSQVQMRTQASLRLGGQAQRLQGLSWLDQEWSDQLLGSPQTPQDEAVGWDWAGINLADGSALTVFRLRRANGSVLWSGGSWRSHQGVQRNFAPTELSMKPLRQWRSPGSSADYPVAWLIQCPAGEFRLNALLDAQEVDARMSTGMRYWEGVAALSSPSGQQLGVGYLEMTGYAGRMRLG
ncbi:MAG: lipocalin-like domain-containing protein [Ideonella sp.]|nr:lipocalin-like domain-containing protein [Ideonella sp.]